MSTAAIIKAITEKLRVKYPAITVENIDIESPPLPSFYVRELSDKPSREADGICLDKMSFEIVYFAETHKDGYVDLLAKKEWLKTMLGQPIKTSECYVMPDDIDINPNVRDSVLNITFNVDVSDGVEDSPYVVGDNEEYIDTLYVDGIKETEDEPTSN